MKSRHPKQIASGQHKLKIVLFGSSKYSTIVQGAIYKKFGLTLAVTTPDRTIGRKRIITQNPVKKFAIENKIAFLTFDVLDKEAVEKISNTNPDFIVVADYGKILPDSILKIPKYAPLNVHHSLLPKYRGPSPAPSAILAGEKKSGVTIIEMTLKVDAGDILAQKEYLLASDETAGPLLITLNKLGAEILIKVIADFINGKIKRTKQDKSKATYTHKFKKEDGFIDLDNPPDAKTLGRMIRAYYPWPGVYTKLKVKSQKSKIIKFLPNKPFLIQPEGKRPLTIEEFQNGYPEVFEKLAKLIPVRTNGGTNG